MEILVGALALLVLLDLLLTFGVIRRLREHSATLATWSRVFSPQPSLEAGAVVPRFKSMVANTGKSLSVDWLQGATSLVAFHSEGCSACTQQVPDLIEYVKAVRADGTQILLVKAGTAPDNVEAADGDGLSELAELAVVVEEDYGGPIQTAFQVTSFPGYFLVGPDGVILAAKPRARDLAGDAPSAVASVP